MSTQRTQAPESVDTRKSSRLDPLENTIRKKRSFEDGTAGVVLDALDAVLVARGPESVIRCTDREFRTSKRARPYSD